MRPAGGQGRCNDDEAKANRGLCSPSWSRPHVVLANPHRETKTATALTLGVVGRHSSKQVLTLLGPDLMTCPAGRGSLKYAKTGFKTRPLWTSIKVPRSDHNEWAGNVKFYSQKMIELAAAGKLDENDLSPYWKAIVSNSHIQNYLGEMQSEITDGPSEYQLCSERTGGLSVTFEARFFQSPVCLRAKPKSKLTRTLIG